MSVQEIKKIAVMVYTMAVKSVSGKTNTLLLILVAEWLILTLPIDINFVDSSPFQNLPPLPGENAMCTWCSELELEDEPKEETSLLELIRCSTNMLRFWWRYAHLSRWVIDLWKSPKVIDIIYIYIFTVKESEKKLGKHIDIDCPWHVYLQRWFILTLLHTIDCRRSCRQSHFQNLPPIQWKRDQKHVVQRIWAER